MYFEVDTTNRLDKFLASKVDVSRSRVQKSIRNGQVEVDGIIVVDPDYEVTVGNKVMLPEFEPDELKVSDIDLKIVYENDDLAVIDKPAGLVVHPGAGNASDTLSNALLKYFPSIRNVGEPHRPGIVHRLDEDTSGLIVVAKTPAAYHFLKQTFKERDIEKEYLALSHGEASQAHGFIDLPLVKSPKNQKVKVAQAGEGKEAKTEYFVIAESPAGAVDKYTLFRVKLHTGRTHQIRVHLSAVGHPLVGDMVYGGIYKKSDQELLSRQFLHAHRLRFKLMDGTWIELVSPLPEDLKAVLSKLHINYD